MKRILECRSPLPLFRRWHQECRAQALASAPCQSGRGLPHSKTSRKVERAFSLIELMVAIAIIGILAAIILPTLSRSKASARATACLSNLRQIGIALQLYVNDNENRLPTMYDATLGTNALVTNTLLPTVDKVLMTCLANSNLLRCPSDNRALFAQTGSSYAWNTLLNGQDADQLRVLGFAFNAHEIPVFFDKEAFHRERGEGRDVNYLYADGHIKNLLAIERSK